MMPLHAGQRVGPFEILAPIGQGGMGEVYRARDGKLGRDVAMSSISGSPRRSFEQAGLVFDDRNPPSGGAHRRHDVGQRFLVVKSVSSGSDGSDATIVVVQNWFEEVKRLVP
jgi:serine/threonine protein kinase